MAGRGFNDKIEGCYMRNKCPKCFGLATITKGRFRDLTNAKFDTDYTDGIIGMASGVKITCPECGEINLFLSDWYSLIHKKKSTDGISTFQKTHPDYKGVIPLITWIDSCNHGSIDS